MSRTFDQICGAEPRIRALYALVNSAMADNGSLPEQRWVNLKWSLCKLVGWEADRSDMQGSDDYETAMRYSRMETERCCKDL